MTRNTAVGRKEYFIFLTSQCITLFGSTLVQMSLVWYATMQTSSGTWVATFTVCSYLPQFLISFLGGVWADRYHRKKLDHRRRPADCSCHFYNGIGNSSDFIRIYFAWRFACYVDYSVFGSRNTNASSQCRHPTTCPGRSAYAVQWHLRNNAVYCKFCSSSGGRCVFLQSAHCG